MAYIIYYLLCGIGFVFAIINLGIQPSTIITLLATMGLAIGLALQGILTNIISGVYISFSDIFNIGDTIKINNFIGKVKSFNLFNTIITDNESKVSIIIPNNQLQLNIITNYTDKNY